MVVWVPRKVLFDVVECGNDVVSVNNNPKPLNKIDMAEKLTLSQKREALKVKHLKELDDLLASESDTLSTKLNDLKTVKAEIGNEAYKELIESTAFELILSELGLQVISSGVVEKVEKKKRK